MLPPARTTTGMAVGTSSVRARANVTQRALDIIVDILEDLKLPNWTLW